MGNEPSKGIDPATLEPGRRYQVDHKHVRLRRSFRMIGSYVGTEQRPPAEAGDAPITVLVFEVKPRFGKPARQIVDVSQLQSIVEV